MAPATYAQGSRIVFEIELRDPRSEALVDPTAVLFTIEKPGDEPATYTHGEDGSPIVKASPGRYRAEVDADASGTYFFRWHTSGSYQGAVEGSAVVTASRFA